LSALLLLSGGIESSALAWWRRSDHLLFVDYGQLAARGEKRAAELVADATGRSLEVLRIDCRAVGAGLLAALDVAKDAPGSEWWPFRNQLLITFGAARALALGCTEVSYGAVADDVAFRDTTPEFVRRIDATVCYQEGGIRINAPALTLSTVELIRCSRIPRDLLARTHSCDVDDFYCDQCPSCLARRQVLLMIDSDAQL
jgi:7-cyano-7-deazaguanine synthase